MDGEVKAARALSLEDIGRDVRVQSAGGEVSGTIATIEPEFETIVERTLFSPHDNVHWQLAGVNLRIGPNGEFGVRLAPHTEVRLTT